MVVFSTVCASARGQCDSSSPSASRCSLPPNVHGFSHPNPNPILRSYTWSSTPKSTQSLATRSRCGDSHLAGLAGADDADAALVQALHDIIRGSVCVATRQDGAHLSEPRFRFCRRRAQYVQQAQQRLRLPSPRGTLPRGPTPYCQLHDGDRPHTMPRSSGKTICNVPTMQYAVELAISDLCRYFFSRILLFASGSS